MRHRVESSIPWTWALAGAFVFSAACAAALAAETPSPAPVVTSPPAPVTAATETEHLAKGEVRYGDKWVSVDALFKDYGAARAEIRDVAAQSKEPRDRLTDLQHQLFQMKTEGAAAERPIRAEAAKAKIKQRDYKKALDEKPPARPQLIPLPRQPLRSNTGSSSGYSSQSDQAYQRWQDLSDAINQQNQQLQQKYKMDSDDYKKKQDEAKKELPKLDDLIKQDEQKLDQMATDLQTKQGPILGQIKAVNEEVLASHRLTTAAETRLRVLAEALRASPEGLRLSHGIVEWETIFYAFAELQKLYTDTQGEINRVHNEMKTEAEKAGQSFPPDWRHPQQDRMDALKILLDKARVSLAAAPKPDAPAAPPPTAPAPIPAAPPVAPASKAPIAPVAPAPTPPPPAAPAV